MITEFSLIQSLADLAKPREGVVLGIGDDAAVVEVPEGRQLVVSTDTLNEGKHFPKDTLPIDIGYKALAVSLSDLAAMGAKPAYVLVNLSLPALQNEWLAAFKQGLFELISQYDLQLIGGDTACGPLQITTTVLGWVPKGEALTRSGAKPGDKIYVSGTLGDAGLALQDLENAPDDCLQRLNRPTAQVELGLELQGKAHSCIDISDGLAQDLGHILKQSHVGATLYVERLPLSDSVKNLDKDTAWDLALTSGDDYELCFTAPTDVQLANVTCIGEIEKEIGLRIKRLNGGTVLLKKTGYEHFKK